jgi:hypothetical protein
MQRAMTWQDKASWQNSRPTREPSKEKPAASRQTRAAQPAGPVALTKTEIDKGSKRSALLLPSALLVAIRAQFLAAFMLVDLRFATLFQ